MSKRRTKKGFTFMELVIVIAIFAIIVGVLTPAWAHYLQRSKYKAQNAKAKAVFNAAQTVIIDLEFAERKYRTLYGSQAGIEKYIYTPVGSETGATDNEWFYYWNGTSGYRCEGTSGRAKVTSDSANRTKTFDEWNEKIGKAIQRIVSEDMTYVVWVKDYKVQAVVSGNNTRDHYIGAHPTTIFELDAAGEDISAYRSYTVLTAPINKFDLDMTD